MIYDAVSQAKYANRAAITYSVLYRIIVSINPPSTEIDCFLPERKKDVNMARRERVVKIASFRLTTTLSRF